MRGLEFGVAGRTVDMAYQDISIDELVKQIERGEIRLPEMQRQYVWQRTRVRDFLDSLYRGYPSGTILMWKTNEDVATRDFAVEQPDQKSFQLLLDGQQRLTSLSAILRGSFVRVKNRKRPIDILFNLEHWDDLGEVTEVTESSETESSEDEGADDDVDADLDFDMDEGTADANHDDFLKKFERMTFVVHSDKIAANPQWVSVTKVFKGATDQEILHDAGVISMTDPRYGKYTDRLKRLRAIKDYSYRVHVLDQDKSYEEVTEIFVRVNSLGAKLRSSDLALAQITAKWRDSLSIFQSFEAECKQEGFDVGMAIYLKNLVAFATGQSRFNTVGGLSKEKLESAWPESKQGMRYALNFLKSNGGIDSPALLSSSFLIIALAYYGHLKKYQLSSAEEQRLRYWALLANTKGHYSRGATETFLDQDLAILRKGGDVDALLEILETQVGRLEVVPSELENRDSRSAHFKTMFLAFQKSGACDWRDQLVISLKHVGMQHSLQFHHIFPRNLLKGRDVSSRMINNICNMSFISGKTNRRISDKAPAEYLPKIVEENGVEILEKQCIPTDSSLWTLDAYEDFLKRRREMVAERLNLFLGTDKMS